MLNRLTSFVIRMISQFFRSLGFRSCRFEPSCSVYAQDVFKAFPWISAMRLTAGRFLRCHPFCEGGFDPAPSKDNGMGK